MDNSSLYTGNRGGERRTNDTGLYSGRERRAALMRVTSRSDERRLVERASARDRQAFAQLYDRFVDKIYKYIYYKVG
ncbi:MAG: RNA polymerase subunit sigma-24, partial [Chloroflexi bacterium]|nr:RNA polymerase subunit sigma-24 [Chloroflexota bacterium]